MSQQSAQPVPRRSASLQDDPRTDLSLGGDRTAVSSSGMVPRRPPLAVRVVRRLHEDIAGTRFRFLAVQALISLIPRLAFGWLRAILYRAVGVRIGPSTYVFGKIEIEGVGNVLANVRIGESCLLTTPLYLNASGGIEIGDRVTVGHHVMIITDNHRMSDPLRRGGERLSSPVKIEDGAWIGARATILPGVTLGRGCVVAAGAVVAHDVPAHTLVGGVPARHISDLEQ